MNQVFYETAARRPMPPVGVQARAHLGLRRAFTSAFLADAYDRGWQRFPLPCFASSGSAERSGWEDHREQADVAARVAAMDETILS